MRRERIVARVPQGLRNIMRHQLRRIEIAENNRKPFGQGFGRAMCGRQNNVGRDERAGAETALGFLRIDRAPDRRPLRIPQRRQRQNRLSAQRVCTSHEQEQRDHRKTRQVPGTSEAYSGLRSPV